MTWESEGRVCHFFPPTSSDYFVWAHPEWSKDLLRRFNLLLAEEVDPKVSANDFFLILELEDPLRERILSDLGLGEFDASPGFPYPLNSLDSRFLKNMKLFPRLEETVQRSEGPEVLPSVVMLLYYHALTRLERDGFLKALLGVDAFDALPSKIPEGGFKISSNP